VNPIQSRFLQDFLEPTALARAGPRPKRSTVRSFAAEELEMQRFGVAMGVYRRSAAVKVEIPMSLAEKSGKTGENPKIPGLKPL
jgi:hypothetical protein